MSTPKPLEATDPRKSVLRMLTSMAEIGEAFGMSIGWQVHSVDLEVKVDYQQVEAAFQRTLLSMSSLLGVCNEVNPDMLKAFHPDRDPMAPISPKLLEAPDGDTPTGS